MAPPRPMGAGSRRQRRLLCTLVAAAAGLCAWEGLQLHRLAESVRATMLQEQARQEAPHAQQHALGQQGTTLDSVRDQVHRRFDFWVINLAKRPERLACVMQEFNRIGWRPTSRLLMHLRWLAS